MLLAFNYPETVLILCSAPIGIPHRVAEDDWYEGMLIPKDSTIFIPSWALHHSERYGYDDPFAFKPERYANHPKLANDYAGVANYNDRDKLPEIPMLACRTQLTACSTSLRLWSR
jgi:hypothetical protein